jgi:hypothetical protein
MLVINLDIGDVVLENGRDIDLTGEQSQIMFDFSCDPEKRDIVSEIGVWKIDKSLPRGRCPWRKHCDHR